MRLFGAVNRKIKFREKDYVERNYIRDDGKAVIPIYLESLNQLYMDHDYKKLVLSDSIYDYIEEIASIIPFKNDIVLEFHCPELSREEQERVRKIIKNNYGMDIDDIDYNNRMTRYMSLALFIFGIAIIILAYLFNHPGFEVIEEFFIIFGWVVIWRMLESLLFSNNERKIERLNKLQLYDSTVEFVFNK